jgi:hypothetical protein
MPANAPPQDPVYQSMVSPGPAVPIRVVDWPAQMTVSDPAPGVAGRALTVIVRETHVGLTHPVPRLRARAK